MTAFEFDLSKAKSSEITALIDSVGSLSRPAKDGPTLVLSQRAYRFIVWLERNGMRFEKADLTIVTKRATTGAAARGADGTFDRFPEPL